MLAGSGGRGIRGRKSVSSERGTPNVVVAWQRLWSLIVAVIAVTSPTPGADCFYLVRERRMQWSVSNSGSLEKVGEVHV